LGFGLGFGRGLGFELGFGDGVGEFGGWDGGWGGGLERFGVLGFEGIDKVGELEEGLLDDVVGDEVFGFGEGVFVEEEVLLEVEVVEEFENCKCVQAENWGFGGNCGF
jgi:hypothetical protein